MADEEGKLSKQDLKILEIRNRLEEENIQKLAEQRKLTSEIIDDLEAELKLEKSILKANSEQGTLEKNSLKVIKDVFNFQSKLLHTYDDIKKVQQDIKKAKDLEQNLSIQMVALAAKQFGIKEETLSTEEARNRLAIEKVKYDNDVVEALQKQKATEEKLVEIQKQNQKKQEDLINQLKEKKKITASEQREHDAKIKALDLEVSAAERLSIEAKNNVEQTKQSKSIYVAQYEALAAASDELEAQINYLKEQEKVQKNLTTNIDKLEKGLDRIGLKPLVKMLGLDKVNEKMKKFRYELTEGGTKGLSKIGSLAVGFKGLGAVISTALGPLTLISLAIIGIKKLIDKVKHGYEEGKEAAKKISEENVGLARSLGLAQGAASGLAASVRGLGPTAEASVQSVESIYSAMGGTEKLSQNTLKTFIQLNTYAGMSAENLAEFHNYAKLSGKDSGVVVKNMANAALSSIKNNKLAVSQKVLLGDVAKVSDVIKLRYQGQEKELVKIVADAKKYGLELAKAEDIANSLLNIEDSLSAEMEAELLTGKELNLEEARRAALNGDVEKLTSEIAKNAGSIEEFNSMNVMQQESIAKAVGLSRQELAKMLKDQKSNLALNGNLVDEQQDGLAAMKSGISLAEQESNIERAKQEASMGYFKALYPLIEKIKEAATRVKKVFADWIGKKLEDFLSRPDVKDFIEKLPEKAEHFAKSLTETLDKLQAWFSKNPWFANIAIALAAPMSGRLLGGLVGGIGSGLGKLAIGAVTGKKKEKGQTSGDPLFTEDVGMKKAKTDIKSHVTKRVNDLAKTMANETKKGVKKQTDAVKKGAKQQSDAVKKTSRNQVRAIQQGAKGMKKATDNLNKNVKAQGRDTKRLFSGLQRQMSGLFRNLNSAVSRIGRGAGGMGGMLGMLGPIGMIASVALPVASALLSGEGAGGALEALDPTGLVSSARMGIESNTPEMATGGIVKRRTKAVIGEAGPEAVIPLNKFYAKLDQLIHATREGKNIYMDSRKVGEGLTLGGFQV